MKNVYLESVEKFREDYNNVIVRGIEHARKCMKSGSTNSLFYMSKIGGFVVDARVTLLDKERVDWDGKSMLARLAITLPNTRPYIIGIDQSDIDNTPSMEDSKDVLDDLLENVSSSAIQAWMDKELKGMIDHAIENKNFERLTEISSDLIKCDFGDHFALVELHSPRPETIQHRVDIDDRLGLFFTKLFTAKDYFTRSYMGSLRAAILMGWCYKDTPIVLGMDEKYIQE